MNLTAKGGQQVRVFPCLAAGQQSDEVLVEGHAEVVVDKAGCKERHQPALLGPEAAKPALASAVFARASLANPATPGAGTCQPR